MASLFSPLQVKEFTLKSRIVMPPMANNVADENGAVIDAHIEHYVRRAPGVGMVIVEHAYVRRDGRYRKRQLGIHDDALIPGLRRLAEAIKACDTVVGIQITHGGGVVTQETAKTQPVAPSEGILPPEGTEPARGLRGDEMMGIVDAFVAAAQRALAAGFDFVEVHGAHGYLLSQFLSPLANRRSDEYGGSLENRLRLPLQVVEAVRQVVDTKHLLLYRLGADDLLPGGLTQQEGRQAARALTAAGVDLLDISGGLGGAETPDWDGTSQGYFVPMGAAIQAQVDVPVVVTGGITDAQFADQVIRSGQVELIGVGRALLSNPDWVIEARTKLGQ